MAGVVLARCRVWIGQGIEHIDAEQVEALCSGGAANFEFGLTGARHFDEMFPAVAELDIGFFTGLKTDKPQDIGVKARFLKILPPGIDVFFGATDNDFIVTAFFIVARVFIDRLRASVVIDCFGNHEAEDDASAYGGIDENACAAVFVMLNGWAAWGADTIKRGAAGWSCAVAVAVGALGARVIREAQETGGEGHDNAER